MLSRDVDFFFDRQWLQPHEAAALRTEADRREARRALKSMLASSSEFKMGTSVIRAIDITVDGEGQEYLDRVRGVMAIEFFAQLQPKTDVGGLGLDPRIVANLGQLIERVAADSGGSASRLPLMAVSVDQGKTWRLAADHTEVKAAYPSLMRVQ
jgi:hypothetical protein